MYNVNQPLMKLADAKLQFLRQNCLKVMPDRLPIRQFFIQAHILENFHCVDNGGVVWKALENLVFMIL